MYIYIYTHAPGSPYQNVSASPYQPVSPETLYPTEKQFFIDNLLVRIHFISR